MKHLKRNAIVIFNGLLCFTWILETIQGWIQSILGNS